MNQKSSARNPLVLHEAIGYEIRQSHYLEYAMSTFTLAEQAVKEGRFSDAARLGNYTTREAVEAHELYRDWIVDFRREVSRVGA